MNCAGLVKYENHTHVKKMGHTLEFLFGIYWWTWKTTIKKKRILIFTVLQEKHPDISLFYTCVPKFLIWYTVLDIECDRLKLAIMGHYLPFYTPSSKPKKSKEKNNCWRYHHFTQVYQKPHSYEVCFLRHNETDKQFCYLGPFFALLTP